MMEGKWTKGPWEVGSHPAMPGTNIVRPVLFGSRVRVLPQHEGGHVSLNSEADARLIAQAPAMAEALEKLLALIDRDAAANEANYATVALAEPEVADARALIAAIKGDARERRSEREDRP